MKGKHLLFLFMLLAVLFACNNQEKFDLNKLASFEVEQTIAEVSKGDYLFRLKSLKPIYKIGESIELIGEIEYLGDRNEVTIHHSAKVIHYSIEEKVRGYTIDTLVAEIGVSSNLKKGVGHKEKFEKNVIFTPEEPTGYVEFIDKVQNEKGFPPGYYVVKAVADFYEPEADESMRIETKVDFKVE